MLGHELLSLTPTELRLLIALASDAEQILSRDRLAREGWGYASASNNRTIDVHIRRLRLKLASRRTPGPAIVSVRAMGYRLTAGEAASTAA
ncbi:MAG TPA: helix-turn-helix domain-containing protein [Chloroflexota bacterium]|jgi:two-component system response regulator MtrA|nr:helix-turn-helix domain-containing protein [Chloroflexota bacterium]